MLRKIITALIILSLAAPLVILAMNYCGNCSKADQPAAPADPATESTTEPMAEPALTPAETPAPK